MAIEPSDIIYFDGKECKDVTFDGHECSEAWFPVNGNLECVWRKEQEITTGNYFAIGSSSLSYSTNYYLSVFNNKRNASATSAASVIRGQYMITNYKLFFVYGDGALYVSKNGIEWHQVQVSNLNRFSYCHAIENGVLLEDSYYSSGVTTRYFVYIELDNTTLEVVNVNRYQTNDSYSSFTYTNFLPGCAFSQHWNKIYTKTGPVDIPLIKPNDYSESGWNHTFTVEWITYRNGKYFVLIKDFYGNINRDRRTRRFIRTSTNLTDWSDLILVNEGFLGADYNSTIGAIIDTDEGFILYGQANYYSSSFFVKIKANANMANWQIERMPDRILIDSPQKTALVLDTSTEAPDGYFKARYSYPRNFAMLNAMYSRGKIVKPKAIAGNAAYYGGTFSQGNTMYFIDNFNFAENEKNQAFNADGQAQRGEDPPTAPFLSNTIIVN